MAMLCMPEFQRLPVAAKPSKFVRDGGDVVCVWVDEICLDD